MSKKWRGGKNSFILVIPKLSLSVPSQELVELLVGLKQKMSTNSFFPNIFLTGKMETEVSPVWPVAPRIAILIIINLKLGELHEWFL